MALHPDVHAARQLGTFCSEDDLQVFWQTLRQECRVSQDLLIRCKQSYLRPGCPVLQLGFEHMPF